MARQAKNPGIGRGHGERTRRTVQCKDCGGDFLAARSDALRCPSCNLVAKRVTERKRERVRAMCACGKPMARTARTCRACRAITQRGAGNHFWKGGRSVRHDGYVTLKIDGRNVLEHRKVYEDAHGPLAPGEVVHHLNGIKSDNRLENLFAVSNAGHQHRTRMVEPFEARVRELESRLAELGNA